MRRVLRWLWEYHGAPKLDQHISRYPGLRPRNVTVSEDERHRILASAEPYMRLWILLCSDLAIRSGTAMRLNSTNYDPIAGTLRFATKYGAKLTLPTTDEIENLIRQCDQDSTVPYVRQLWTRRGRHPGRRVDPQSTCKSGLSSAWRKLCHKLGITRRIVPHDLRRTTAVAMLRATGDIREVQSLLGHRSLQATIWYLDHDLRPVNRKTLELIKRPHTAESERTA